MRTQFGRLSLALMSALGVSLVTGSGLSAAAGTPNPCKLLSKAEMSATLGATVSFTSEQGNSAGSTCTYGVSKSDTSDGYGTVFVDSTSSVNASAKAHHTIDIATVSGFTKYYLAPRGAESPMDVRVAGIGKAAGYRAASNEIDVLTAVDLVSIDVFKTQNGVGVPVPESILESLARDALKNL
jgi:hypothetical protein